MILSGGGLVRSLLLPLRRVVVSDLVDWVQRHVQLGWGVPLWIMILGLGFDLNHLLGVVGLVVVLVWGLNLDTCCQVPGLLVSLFGFLLFFALGVRRREDLYLCVVFLGLDLVALATFAGLLVFSVSSKLGHAAAVLVCAAVVPEAFLAHPAASSSFLNVLVCLSGVLPPSGP